MYERTREGYTLPSSQWQWADDHWTVETKPNVTDKEGWQYAVDFPRFGFISNLKCHASAALSLIPGRETASLAQGEQAGDD